MKHMKETQLSYSDYLGISTYLMKHRAFNLYFGKSIASDARGPGSNPVIDNYLALTFEKSNISKKILGLAHFKQQKQDILITYCAICSFSPFSIYLFEAIFLLHFTATMILTIFHGSIQPTLDLKLTLIP